jgi:GT2 family glycosyltransferase
VNATNTGFARGMNQALEASRGDVVVFLNSDCLLEPEFLGTAVDLLATHPEADALAATVVRLRNVDTPTERTGRHPLDGAILGMTSTMRVQHKEQHDDLQPTFKANGACPILRRSLLDKLADRFGVPAFDPVFDTYSEDIDFAFRAAAVGGLTLCSRDLVAWHVRSVSGGGIRVFDKRGRMRTNILAGRYLNCWRHLPLRLALITHPFLMAQDLGLVVIAASKGDRTAIRDVLAAWRRLAANAGELRRFRRAHRTWRAIPRKSVNGGTPQREMVVDLSR